MITVYLATALMMAGAVLGVLGVVCLGIHREERDYSLGSKVSSRVARGARQVTGVGVRGPEPAAEARPRQDFLPV